MAPCAAGHASATRRAAWRVVPAGRSSGRSMEAMAREPPCTLAPAHLGGRRPDGRSHRAGRGAWARRGRRAPSRPARHRRLSRHDRRDPRTGDPGGDQVVSVPPGTGARRHRRARHPPGSRPKGSSADRLPCHRRAGTGMGRSRAPVPPGVARLSVGSHRRRLRAAHAGGAAPLPVVGGIGRGWRGRPRHLASTAETGAPVTSEFRASERGADRRSLWSPRRSLPLRARLHRPVGTHPPAPPAAVAS